MDRTTLEVSGMTCGNCIKHVRKALSKLPSIQDPTVEIGRVELTYDPSQVTVERIVEALSNAGYPAKPQ